MKKGHAGKKIKKILCKKVASGSGDRGKGNYVVIINYPAGEILLIPADGERHVDNFFTIGIKRNYTDKAKQIIKKTE